MVLHKVHGREHAVELASALLDRMIVLAKGGGAIELRIGELLATLRQMDLRLLGYSTYTAFIAEEVDFDGSWGRQLAALARSELELVKVALCRGKLPISVAVKAPGTVAVDEQVGWIGAFLDGSFDPRQSNSLTGSARRQWVDLEDPEQAKLVHEMRIRARTVLGYACSDDVPEVEPLVWVDDAAAELLGPRVVPTSEREALELLREMLFLRRTRRLELGTLYQRMGDGRLYRDLGFSSLKEMAKQALPVTQRTLQDCQEQAQAMAFYPELAAALAEGMDVARLMTVFSIATEDNVGRWLTLARRTSLTELRRAVRWAEETVGQAVLETYERALGETKDAHSWVALRAARRPERPPRRIEGVHPDLVDACLWYRDNVPLPRQFGFQKVKERERFTCESPLCNRTLLRCDAHHAIFRSQGGGDEDRNARCLCKACHLRLIHAGLATLTGRIGGPDVWAYANGRRIVVY